MPTINPENGKDVNRSPLDVMMTASYPNLVCGVGRKINTGNYENMDILAAISLPVFMIPDYEQEEIFLQATEAAAALGFKVVSGETGERYNAIKALQAGRK